MTQMEFLQMIADTVAGTKETGVFVWIDKQRTGVASVGMRRLPHLYDEGYLYQLEFVERNGESYVEIGEPVD